MNKGTFIIRALLITGILLGLASLLQASLVNWESHLKWKKEKLQEAVAEVQKKGSYPVFSAATKPYDTNHDGVIDRTEVKAMEAFLGVGEKR